MHNITLNGTILPTSSYFIFMSNSSRIVNASPFNLKHFGNHNLRFTITDGTIFYSEQQLIVNVINRAPYFQLNITANNYTANFSKSTNYILPHIISPDYGYPWVRVISGHSFITITPERQLRIEAKNLYSDLKQHNVTLEVYIDKYPNKTLYYINVTVLNNPPVFKSALVD